MPKKKEIPMPKLENEKMLAKKKVVYYSWVAVIVSVVGLFCLALWARNQPKPEYVEKNVVNNYACQVVDYDNEAQMIAVRCLTK